MKNIFYRILRHYQKWKKAKYLIEIAREELRETNEELETQKKETGKDKRYAP